MATIFGQKEAEIALILVLRKNRGLLRTNSKDFGVAEFKYAI